LVNSKLFHSDHDWPGKIAFSSGLKPGMSCAVQVKGCEAYYLEEEEEMNEKDGGRCFVGHGEETQHRKD